MSSVLGDYIGMLGHPIILTMHGGEMDRLVLGWVSLAVISPRFYGAK